MKFLFTFFCILISAISGGQQQINYPRNYFRNPLDIPLFLAGNFGECRPNHFHTGIDLKTDGQENKKVYAAADGYVSRITIAHSGYGNAIYLAHHNGFTTLYGHLNDFYPELQQYLVQQQYARESWNIDLKLDPGQFPVTKGQFIAFSGTTGGSTGPHLHFEIRDSKTEHVLNAALFGLPIKDTKPPVPRSIALYGAGSVYLQDPQIFALQNRNKVYAPAATTIVASDDQVRIGVYADDYMEGSTNTLGVYEMELFMDEQLQASWRLNDIDFDQNRYVNAFADYKLKEEKKTWYQTLFRVPGNHLNAYTFLNKENGMLDISDKQAHKIRMELRDAAGNRSTIAFTIIAGEGRAKKNCNNFWLSKQNNSWKTASVSFATDSLSLYDDVCFEYSETASKQYYSSVIQLLNTKIPLHNYSELGIKLNRLLPFDLRTKLVFVHHIKAAALPGNNPQDATAARFDKGWAYAAVRTFGNYYVSIDTSGPVISPLQKSGDLSRSREIRFTVSDKMTTVKKFQALLNGKWLRFVRAGNTYTYTFDENCPRGNNTLVIKAWDENDNSTAFTFRFSRTS